MARDHRRLAAIVSFDVAGYSRLMGADESGTLAALKSHRRELVDPKIAEHVGRIVKTTGDGLLVEFSSVVDAVRCAVEVQRAMAERNVGVPAAKRLEFRIGINVGDIIIDGDDIFGDGVNVAARLEGLAEPGGICVSRVVRDQVLDKLGFSFEDLGPKEVKNIVRPVEVYRVALDSEVRGSTGARKSRPAHHRFDGIASTKIWFGAAALIGVLIAGLAAYRAYIHSPATIAPYSMQDRRMTFGVLPVQAPANDAAGAQVAAATTDAIFAVQEADVLWAQVASRRSAEEAVAKAATDRDIAKLLDVHFLVRGNLIPTATGYDVELLVVDAPADRAIGTRTLPAVAGALSAGRREELADALSALTYKALGSEVQRARSKPVDKLDVRGLSFRAFVDWNDRKQERDHKGAYITATDLLNRALTLVPDDPLALYLTARVNLCDCVDAWSTNVEKQQTLGAAALEQYLRRDPESAAGLLLKSKLFALRGRYEEALLVADSVLARTPGNVEALTDKAYILTKLGRPREALAVIKGVLAGGGPAADKLAGLAASIHYALGQYDDAARMARTAVTRLDPDQLRNRRLGAVGLTLVAAEARQGNLASAKAALADFNVAVPDVKTVAAVRKWMHPGADLAGYDPLFEGLQLAGVGE